jgi:hypothetical protein
MAEDFFLGTREISKLTTVIQCICTDEVHKIIGRGGDAVGVRAVVPAHLKNAGTHVGRMSAKASGSFTIATGSKTVTDIGKQDCRKLQRADGYGYCCLRTAFFPPTP